MLFSVKFTQEATQDVQEVYEWYELQLVGLGDKFLSFVHDAMERLAVTPGIGSIRFDDIHCIMLKKFPYFVYYSFDTTNLTITVYRIFHSSRKPLWEK